MTRTIALLLPLFLAPTGCIVYENNGDANFDGDEDWWDDEGDDFGWNDADDDAEPAPSLGLVLAPDHAAPGETLLVTLSSDIDIDLSVVTEVWFHGDVTVEDLVVSEDEVLIVASVDPDAASGPIGVTIGTCDGEEWSVEVPFTVVPTEQDDDGCGP